MKNCVVVIPALNPPKSLLSYLRQMQAKGFERIVIVDDGSRTDKLPLFARAERLGCVVLHHEENRGKGQALKTAFSYYLAHCAGESDGILTVDVDRFVPVVDLEKMASSLHNIQRMGSCALVVGVRNFASARASKFDRNMNTVTRTIYRMLLGAELQDPLSGTLGIPDLRVDACLKVRGSGYEYESALLIEMEKDGLAQVPIHYPVEQADTETHYRKGKDTFRIMVILFRNLILYGLTSLTASLADVLLFGLFSRTLFADAPLSLVKSTILARILSASLNYVLTKRFVFRTGGGAQERARSAGLFMLLSGAQCLCSAFSVQALAGLGGSDIGWKVVVDLVLFFISYQIQRRYIFRDGKKKE